MSKRDLRNNKTAETGLMLDVDGDIFDRTEWLKRNDLMISLINSQYEQIQLLRTVVNHLQIMTGEEIGKGDLD